MADLSTPLDWNLPKGPGAGPAAPEKAAPEEFCWPHPPFASYPAPAPQTDPMPCQIVGLNDKQLTGRLTTRKVGRRRIILAADLAAWLDALPVG